MRILCLLNRDLASNLALNCLLPHLGAHELQVGLTERVGAPANDEPRARRDLRVAEQELPNGLWFPLVERASLRDDGERLLTFAEIERRRGIRVLPLPRPNAAEGLATIARFAPDLVLTIRYGAILKTEAIALARLGVVNLHSGVLPDYRGVLATFRALLAGDREIGCTVHYIQDGTIDTGDILGIRRIAVDPARSLLWHVLELYRPGCELLAGTVTTFAQGARPASRPQPAGGGRYYSYPTPAEWLDFERRGWRVADVSDLRDALARYGSAAPDAVRSSTLRA